MTQQTATGLRGAGAPRTALTTALRLPDASVSSVSLAAYGLALLVTALLTQALGGARHWPLDLLTVAFGLASVLAMTTGRHAVDRAARHWAWCLTVVGVGAIALLIADALPARPYGDGAIFAAFVAEGRAMPRWLIGSAAASTLHAAIWQHPLLHAWLPETLRTPAAFLAVLGTSTMVFGTWALWRRWPGRLALLLPALTPVWVLFASGYVEYYPIIATAFLGALAWLFDRPLTERRGTEIGVLTAVLALAYVAFVPVALLVLVTFALARRDEAARAVLATVVTGTVIVATCWPEGVTHYVRALYAVINVGEANLMPRYAGQVAGPTSIFFGAHATLTSTHARDVAYALVWGGGWWTLPALAAAAWSWRDTPDVAWRAAREPRAWLAAGLLVWHLAYLVCMVPRLGPEADIDLFFPTYVYVPFLAGLLLDLRTANTDPWRGLVVAVACGALVLTVPWLAWFGLPAVP